MSIFLDSELTNEERAELRSLRASLWLGSTIENVTYANSPVESLKAAGARIEFDKSGAPVAVDLQGCRGFSDSDMPLLKHLKLHLRTHS